MTRNRILLALAASALVGSAPLAAQSSVRPVKTQPGFYRFMVGDIEVTVLNDGVVPYQTALLLPTAKPDEIKQALFASGLTDPVDMSYTAYVINTGGKLVMIDTGTGGKLADSPFFRGTGHVLANLRAAGYTPEQVQEIYITHLGPDHIGGLTQGNTRVFPNATVRGSERELDQFRKRQSPEIEAKNPMLGFYRGLFGPYSDAGKLVAFSQDTALAPGVRSLATYGHTVGHTSYVVESKGQKLILLGDLVLVGAIQFQHPDLESSFDGDRPGGARQRERLMEMATKEDLLVAGSHLSFPGIGRIRADGQAYRFGPITYGIPQ